MVVAGNMAKFGQNPKLRRKLLATGNRLLATGNRLLIEATSRDRVWGSATRQSMPCSTGSTRARTGWDTR